MATITLPLTDLVLDPEQPADLAALPAGSTETSASSVEPLAEVGEALARLRPAYDFLGTEATVTLEGGVVTISVPDAPAGQVNVSPAGDMSLLDITQ